MEENISLMNNFVETIIDLLGENYRGDKNKVITLSEDYWQIAINESHRKMFDKKLVPYVHTAVLSAYDRLGKEGSKSSSEGSLSDSYTDIVATLKKDSLSVRVMK